MCKNVKQNVLFERSEFTFCSFCMCKSRPETKSEDEAPKQKSLNRQIESMMGPFSLRSTTRRQAQGPSLASALATQNFLLSPFSFLLYILYLCTRFLEFSFYQHIL